VIDSGQWLSALFDRLLSPGACQTYAGLAMFLGAMLLVELRQGRGIGPYLARSFRTDLLYTLLIVGGMYGLIQQPLINWIDSLIRQHASFFYLDLLRRLPEPLQLVAFLVAVDFCRYWKHRLLHASPYLWPFHSIHHAPEKLNFLVNYRLHLVEHLIDGVVTLVPVVLLGVPTHIWLPVNFLLVWYTSLHHCDLDLSFGWFERIFVSPRFHAAHHSADKRDYDTNFGDAFSIWDLLFGTARFKPSRPQAYGVATLDVPLSFVGQLFFPLKHLAYQIRSKLPPRSRASLNVSSPTEEDR
jgi:sterol desaturase/sphingolipid hydroxylase (fatty acid hydroxylase superfamily)